MLPTAAAYYSYVFKKLFFLIQFVHLSLVDSQRQEQTQTYCKLSLCWLAPTVGESRSKREANDTTHKMATPLGRLTLYCDNCYLITRGKHRHTSPFFMLCQHFGKANISLTTLPVL